MGLTDDRFIQNPDFEDVISELSQVESGKRQHYRPVYSLHKWWARRPGALFRSIILLACKPELRSSLFAPLGQNKTVSELSAYFESHDLNHTIIFDPFMGGGTTLIEGNRLGARVVGCDVNPVSYWIVREALKQIDLRKLNNYFQFLEQQAGQRIKMLYRTTCSSCGNDQSDTLYAFWVRYVLCPHCGEKVFLYKRTFLNEGRSRTKPLSQNNPADVFCPTCFALNPCSDRSYVNCGQCLTSFDPQNGTYDNGYYDCHTCGRQKISLIETLGNGQKLEEKLIAIEYWCPRCKERLYKSPDAPDLERLEALEKEFEATKHKLIIPEQRIAEGSSSVRWRQHNYRYYGEIFNTRQLLAFNYLLRAILNIPEKDYRDAFITVFSNSLEYNNMMTPYNYPHRKLHHLFNYHAMPLTTTPVENSVWGVSDEGAGTFVNCYGRYVRAKKYCERPFDRFKTSSGQILTVYSKKEKIGASFVSTFEELKLTERGAMLLCGDSGHVPDLPDNSVDFVITDPPYFDNIHYSELSNFFYVWLSRLTDEPYFKTEYVPSEQEAIVNKGLDKGEEEYQQLLSAVFSECHRVLKDEGLFAFTFHHTNWRAWWTMLNAVVQSGFVVADFFPVMSEYKVNPHVRNKQAMDMDLVLICRKRTGTDHSILMPPAEVLEHAKSNLSSIPLNGSAIRLFLHFVGELLKTASLAWNKERPVSFEWFSETLSQFDRLAEHLKTQLQMQPEPEDEKQIVQLKLF